MRVTLPPLRAGILVLLPLLALVAGQAGARHDSLLPHRPSAERDAGDEGKQSSRPVIDDGAAAWTRTASTQRCQPVLTECAAPGDAIVPERPRGALRRHNDARTVATPVTHGSSPRSPPAPARLTA